MLIPPYYDLFVIELNESRTLVDEQWIHKLNLNVININIIFNFIEGNNEVTKYNLVKTALDKLTTKFSSLERAKSSTLNRRSCVEVLCVHEAKMCVRIVTNERLLVTAYLGRGKA